MAVVIAGVHLQHVSHDDVDGSSLRLSSNCELFILYLIGNYYVAHISFYQECNYQHKQPPIYYQEDAFMAQFEESQLYHEECTGRKIAVSHHHQSLIL